MLTLAIIATTQSYSAVQSEQSNSGVADSRYESTFGLMLQNSPYLGHSNWAIFHSYLYSATPQFFTDAGLACFGSGLPSVAAAQLIHPNKKVFLLCGDGGLHSGSGDLETLVRHQLPIIIILINYSSLGLIELYQKKRYSKKVHRKEIVSFANVDFVKLAKLTIVWE